MFIQVYSEANFAKELEYAQSQIGIAITDNPLHRLPELVNNQAIKGAIVLPLSGKPKEMAAKVKNLMQELP